MNTSSHQYKMQCLARHFLSTASDAAHMQRLFSSYENKRGKAAKDELVGYVVDEQKKQREAIDAELKNQFGVVAA